MKRKPFKPNISTRAKLDETVILVSQSLAGIAAKNGDDLYRQVATANILLTMALTHMLNFGFDVEAVKELLDETIHGLLESNETGIPYMPRILVPTHIEGEIKETPGGVS